MIDCSKDIVEYHNKKVRLSDKDANAMKSRQYSVRSQLENGLKLKGLPKPRMEVQGSFAMKTMIQNDKNDYDIDDGVYFDVKILDRAVSGKEMTPRQARRMVQCAITDKNPSTKCEVRGKCVRVHYKKGCHVDMPVYRLVRRKNNGKGSKLVYEIAINKEWKRSDARDVTNWFKGKNKKRSPGSSNDGQMCRIVRLVKKFSKSHENWNEKMLGGFAITVLVAECYKPNEKREDKALYNTMKAIQVRLNRSLDIKHPVTSGEFIVDGAKGARARFFLKKLAIAKRNLAPLLKSNCTRSVALECWDKVFNTDFFGRRNQNKAKSGKRR